MLYDDFPQLKLLNSRANKPSSNKLDHIVSLNDQFVDEISLQSLSKMDSVMKLIRHTVSAKLFDKDMMLNHIEFCTKVTDFIEVKELFYPRDLKQLGQLRSQLIDMLVNTD